MPENTDQFTVSTSAPPVMPPPLPAAKDRSATAKVRSRAAAFLATGQLEAEVLRTRLLTELAAEADDLDPRRPSQGA